MTKNNKKKRIFDDWYYYDIAHDINELKESDLFYLIWCIIVLGGRNTGKTYSCLKDCYLNKRKFVFVKRTEEDVKLLYDDKEAETEADLSPFKSINRDLGINVRAYKVKKGVGGFFICDEDNKPIGKGSLIGYIVPLSMVSKVKGFDLSDCDWLIFDEFIPQPWDRVSRHEGEQLMDLYKTVSRDREHRGRPPLLLICLANATKASNPVCNIIEIVDTIVGMQNADQCKCVIEDRGIYIHRINDNPEFMEREKQSLIYKAMGNTDWGKMALNNEFAYDDFTAVKKNNLKGYMPVLAVKYRSKTYYLYNKEGSFYMTFARAKVAKVYDLKIENHQKSFYVDYVLDLQEASVEDRLSFETYTMYDLIMNYRSFFRL